jgi:hypothetical protein
MAVEAALSIEGAELRRKFSDIPKAVNPAID